MVVATGVDLPNMPRQQPQPLEAISNVATVKNASDFFMAGSFRAVSNLLPAQERGRGVVRQMPIANQRQLPKELSTKALPAMLIKANARLPFYPIFWAGTYSDAFQNRASCCNRNDRCYRTNSGLKNARPLARYSAFRDRGKRADCQLPAEMPAFLGRGTSRFARGVSIGLRWGVCQQSTTQSGNVCGRRSSGRYA